MSTTYKLLGKSTVAVSGTQSSIIFSNIPQTYTDLVILLSARASVTNYGNGITNCSLLINGSSSNITTRVSRMADATNLNDSSFNYIGDIPNAETNVNTYGYIQVYLSNYRANSNRTFIGNAITCGNTSLGGYDRSSAIVAGLFSSSSQITSIGIAPGVALDAGSTAYLYGVTRSGELEYSNEPTFGIQATGGDVTISGGYKYHVFKSSGTFNVGEPGWVETLVVAGGGGGGGDRGGGGGAGGVKFASMLANNGPNNVIVGAGGIGGSVSGTVQPGGNGNDSSILTVTSVGGGGGGKTTTNNGATGGSGGGGAFDTSGGVGTSGQGNNGGNGNQVGNPFGIATGSGGGGGSGSPGSNGVANGGGAGGTGTNAWSSILNAVNAGVSGRIAGGGGGATDLRSSNNPGSGGAGGGGAGGGTTQGVQGAVNGVTNTGSGGGAGNGGSPQTPGANGGSGIVIIRYPVS